MKEIDLIKHALIAKNSHSKFSNFAVGCSILCEDDTIIYGCNIGISQHTVC